tara:strand:- start:4937 stop:5926 length:990 start_codon:yes stop_codon:yes gene_type:complete
MAVNLSPPRGIPARTTEPRTLSFNERLNRWTTFYSFFPEGYQNTSQGLFGFFKGKLYKMFSSNTHNHFFNNEQKNYYSFFAYQENLSDISTAAQVEFNDQEITPFTIASDTEFSWVGNGENGYALLRIADSNLSSGDTVEVSWTASGYTGSANYGIASGGSSQQVPSNSFRVNGNGSFRTVYNVGINGQVIFYINLKVLTLNISNFKVCKISERDSLLDYSEVDYVSNLSPVNSKVYKGISIDGNQPWNIVSVENERGQDTNNLITDYKTKEGIHYAPIFRDINSRKGLMSGDDIRSQTLIVKLRNISRDPVNMFATGLSFTFSSKNAG